MSRMEVSESSLGMGIRGLSERDLNIDISHPQREDDGVEEEEGEKTVEHTRVREFPSCSYVGKDSPSHIFTSQVQNISNDEYIDSIEKVLNNYQDEDIVKTFENLYTIRYAITPQLEADANLMSVLRRYGSSISPRELMILTQKHFNEYGGFLITPQF